MTIEFTVRASYGYEEPPAEAAKAEIVAHLKAHGFTDVIVTDSKSTQEPPR